MKRLAVLFVSGCLCLLASAQVKVEVSETVELTALRHYTKNRDTYKTLKDYYPKVAKCLNEYVNKKRQRIIQSL